MISGIPQVENMQSPSTNKPVANQYIIKGIDACIIDDVTINAPEIFQSYETVICVWGYDADTGNRVTYLDRDKWNYSNTTGKYLNLFLFDTASGISKVRAKIKSGEYILTNLN